MWTIICSFLDFRVYKLTRSIIYRQPFVIPRHSVILQYMIKVVKILITVHDINFCAVMVVECVGKLSFMQLVL